jgi:hypothetical protein
LTMDGDQGGWTMDELKDIWEGWNQSSESRKV